jgi:hypothetical protein
MIYTIYSTYEVYPGGDLMTVPYLLRLLSFADL